MKEQFATYEISLKLKELGFDESCLACFTSRLSGKDFSEFWFSDQIWGNSDFHPDVRICKNTDFTNEKSCTAPLWQQVIDWFMEEKGLVIEISKKFEVYISNITEKPFGQVLVEDLGKSNYNLKMNDAICPHKNYLSDNNGKYLYYAITPYSFRLEFPSYKEARKTAILKAIELIENK